MAKHLQNDRFLFAIVILLVFFGLMMVFSASAVIAERNYGTSYYFLIRQGAWAAAGLLGMIWFMQRDYQRFRNPAIVFGFVGITIVALVIALFAGKTANTNRFLRLGPLSLQPSEFAKLALILFLAWFLEKRASTIHEWRTWGPVVAVMGMLALLVLAGRDLGTTFVLILITGVILWVAGLNQRLFAIGVLGVIPLLAGAILLEPYRFERLITFLNPWKDPQGKGFQIIQSMIAVGTGGWSGLGLMGSIQKLYYLPAPHTDFIYAVVGEEFGLVGAVFVLLAFCLILWRGVRAALRASDSFGLYLAAGLTAMLVCQGFINMSVVLDLAPTKGMPLPFISYGGSSMVCALWASGILMSVSQHSG